MKAARDFNAQIRERHTLQVLINGEWRRADQVFGDHTLRVLVRQGLLEERGGASLEYRITEAGRKTLADPAGLDSDQDPFRYSREYRRP